MVTTHDNCSAESREFCDSTLDSLRLMLPGVVRGMASICTFTVPGSNQFAYLYHKRHSLLATVYLRGDEPEIIPQLSESASFQLREKLGSKWAVEFPTLIHIPTGVSSSDLANRLLTYSLPLAGKKSRTRSQRLRFNDIDITDGKIRSVLSTQYERSKTLRTLCLHHFGYQCQGCDLFMADRYGAIAETLIHVHHVERLADTGERVIDPKVDLIPLCPNCHSVVHLRRPPITMAELRKMIKH